MSAMASQFTDASSSDSSCRGAQRGHALEQRLELLFDSIHLLVCQLLQCCRLSVKSCIGFDLGQRQPEVLKVRMRYRSFVVVGVQALVLRTLRRWRQQPCWS